MSGKKRILMVDDDREFVAATRMLLETNGFEFCSANDGASGIEAAKTCKPDLIILDVMMTTETEGIDVSCTLRQTPGMAKTPVIMLTSIRRALNLPFAFEPDPEMLPVTSVLEKPVASPRLLEEIRKLLGA